MPKAETPAGPDSLSGHGRPDAQPCIAAEGQDSPQASVDPLPKNAAPAGSMNGHGQSSFDTRPASAVATSSPQAIAEPMPRIPAPAGSNTSHGQSPCDAHVATAVAASIPGQVLADAQWLNAGDSADQPAAKSPALPNGGPLLADPFLALAADVLDDLETVRVANQNRLRQLTRTATDTDGEERGFGLDDNHPDVARLAALVGMLIQAEHQAELNLARLMRLHPLGPWLAARKGIGENQDSRLI